MSDDEFSDGYPRTLVAAGATVHHYWQSGDYGGVWAAHVTLPDGRTGWILDYYGSCSGCDAYKAEFMYGSRESPEKLAEFGRSYFDQLLTRAEALAKCDESDYSGDYARLRKEIEASDV